MTLTPEEIAAEIREILPDRGEYPPPPNSLRQRLFELADRICPPPTCTIDQVEGYEVEWFTRGAVCVSPKGIVWYSWNRGGVPVVPKSEVRPVMHPWPERPAENKEPQ